MIALTFKIVAVEPLLLTQLEGDPNSSVSAPYAPGGALRGALVHRYLKGREADLAEDDDARRLFFDGSTRFLNAYLLDRLGKRTLPAPLSWFYEKKLGLHDGELLYDFSVRPAGHLKQPKNVGPRFCRVFSVHSDDEEDDAWQPPRVEFTTPCWQVTVHTAREREKGRATGNEGAVFRYQALAAGTELGGAILASTEADAAALKGLLDEGDLWLGGSRSGGYGRVQIEDAATVEDWPETGTTPAGLAPGETLAITLLSDAILRDANGGYADRLSAEMLPEPLKSALAEGGVFKQAGPVGGFNRKWGLPLCQAQAVRGGSVLSFKVTGPIAAGVLRDLEREGVGERRAEGFGRVAVNWHRDPELKLRVVEPPLDSPQPVTLAPASRALAGKMAERLLRRDLDRLLAQKIMSAGGEIDTPPSRAQLSRLRAIVLNALPRGDDCTPGPHAPVQAGDGCGAGAPRVSAFLGSLKSRSHDQYYQARIGGQRLLDWLQALLAKPESVWDLLTDQEIAPPQIGDAVVEFRDKLAQEYALRLIEGILHRAAKERSDD